MLRALEEPIRYIASNSGHDGGVIAEEVKSRKDAVGFDANDGEFVDMFKAGIVDPTKVTRSALQNAASIAGLMLTTEAMITNIKDDEKETAPADRRIGSLIGRHAVAAAVELGADRERATRLVDGPAASRRSCCLASTDPASPLSPIPGIDRSDERSRSRAAGFDVTNRRAYDILREA